MEPICNVSNKKDEKGLGPKRFKPNSVPEFESIIASSNDIVLLDTENIEDEDADSPLDEPEIIVEIISAGNMANDPLQVKGNCPDSIAPTTPTKKNQDSPKPVFQNCSVAIDGVKKGSGPIILRKVANPPAALLKKLKPKNVITGVITLQSGDKLIAVQEVMKKNLGKSDSVDGNNKPNMPCSTLAAQQPHKDIVGPKHNEAMSENKQKEKTIIVKKNKKDICVVKGCTGNATQFFRVPNDWRKINIWSYCLNNQKLAYGNLICNQHFIQEDLQKKSKGFHIGLLKPFAVPSSQKVLVGCCISQCINQTQNTDTMYPIPIWGNYQSWLHYMGDHLKITRLHDLQQYRACDRHFFKPSVEDWHKLTPTVYLPTIKEHYINKLINYLKTRAVQDKNEFCTYLGCKSHKDNAFFKFYQFPTEYDSAIKWIEACHRPDILKKTRIEIELFIKDSIGVCFQHKNDVEKNIRRKEMNNISGIKLNKSKDETSNTAVKVYQRRTGEQPNLFKMAVTGVEKSGSRQQSELMLVDLTEEDASPSDSNQLAGEKPYVPSTDYCAFINCSTSKKDLVKKYRFPADNDLLAQWIEASAIPKTLSEDTIRTLFVCGKHFNERQYTEMGTLILSSVPAPHTEFADSSSHKGNEHWIIKQNKTLTKHTGSPRSSEASKRTVTTYYKDSSGSIVSVVSDKLPAVSDALAIDAPPQDRGSVQISNAEADSVPLEDECVVKDCPLNRLTNRMFTFPKENRAMFIRWIKAVRNKSTSITESLYKAYFDKKICEGHFEQRYKVGSMLRYNAVPTLHLSVHDSAEVQDEVIDTSIQNYVPDSVEIQDEVIDTSIQWKECDSEICDVLNSRAPYFKGSAILHENSIEFRNIKRELRFGKHCRKLGPMKRFPYKVRRMTNKNIYGRPPDVVYVRQKVQIHTAVIVDDDDQSEKDAIELLSKIILENDKLAPKRRTRGQGDRIAKLDKKGNT